MRKAASRFCCMLSMLALLSGSIQAEEPEVSWNGIQRLQVDFSANEATPFLQISTPFLGQQTENSIRTVSHETVSNQRDVSPPSTSQEHKTDPVTHNRQELRKSLIRDGQDSLHGRDELTGEVVGMIKWTTTVLVIGALVAVGLKKYQNRQVDIPADKRIRVLESMNLGRQQGLKLVEVGGERFLIASDQGGIKSVTMLPGWPEEDEEEGTEENQFSGPPKIFHETEPEKAAV